MSDTRGRTAIPDPQMSLESLFETALALKQAVEVLANQRGPRTSGSVTWQDLVDLGLISPDQIPR